MLNQSNNSRQSELPDQKYVDLRPSILDDPEYFDENGEARLSKVIEILISRDKRKQEELQDFINGIEVGLDGEIDIPEKFLTVLQNSPIEMDSILAEKSVSATDELVKSLGLREDIKLYLDSLFVYWPAAYGLIFAVQEIGTAVGNLKIAGYLTAYVVAITLYGIVFEDKAANKITNLKERIILEEGKTRNPQLFVGESVNDLFES